MPLMHCMSCDREWEATSNQSLCPECGEGGYILEDTTPLEKYLKDREAGPEGH